MKNGTEVTLKISSNVGDSNDENNFLHKLLLTNRQFSKLLEIIHQLYIKLSTTHLHKIGISGGFLGRPLAPLLKTGLYLNH